MLVICFLLLFPRCEISDPDMNRIRCEGMERRGHNHRSEGEARTGYGIPAHDGVGAGGGGKILPPSPSPPSPSSPAGPLALHRGGLVLH